MKIGIKAIVFDVDGVITDGKKYLYGQQEAKSVSLKDLDAIHMLKKDQYIVGAITGENTEFTQKLKADLELDFFVMGCKQKWTELQIKMQEFNLKKEEICYVGDGKYDLEVLQQVGFSCCPADAIQEVKEASKYVLDTLGGNGCIAEIYSNLHNLVKMSQGGNYNLAVLQRMKQHNDLLYRVIYDEKRIKTISQIIENIIECYRNEGKLLLCGNGGSAADAQHLATELVSRFYKERKALPAVALNVNTSTLTAISNDYQYDRVFSRQVEAFGKEGDVLLGISTSGRARNVIEAFEIAKKRRLKTILLTGELDDDAEIVDYADLIFRVPSKDTPRIQEMHILIGHIICEQVEKSLVEE